MVSVSVLIVLNSILLPDQKRAVVILSEGFSEARIWHSSTKWDIKVNQTIEELRSQAIRKLRLKRGKGWENKPANK